MTNWISTEKRMPTKPDQYLILRESTYWKNLLIYEVKRWDGEKFLNIRYQSTVKYWRELPPIPDDE